jgi:putative ABC transport system ATP-binding protein
VAVARSVVMDPAILLADEPTGNLDSQTGERILCILENLWRRGKTVILVTHNERQAARFPRRVVLKDGRILSDTLAAAERRAS